MNYYKRNKWKFTKWLSLKNITTISYGSRFLMPFNSVLTKLIYFEKFEVSEIKYINSYLKLGDTFIDIGANIGFFTIIAGKIVGEKGCILAFEPTSETLYYLNKNINKNKLRNVNVIPKGLSDKIGKSVFYKSKDGYEAWNSLTKPAISKHIEETEIDLDILDNYINLFNLNNRIFIKIDVEGWEIAVLKGAKRFIETFRPHMMVEFTDENAIAAGFACKELYSLIRSYNYKLFAFDDTGKMLIEEISARENYPYSNLICIPID